jgi:triacylglycerol lipase
VTLLPLLGLFLLPGAALSQGVYLRSAQPLDDDPRGYCLDVAGFGPEFRLDAPLRTHSCKFDGANEDQLYEWMDGGHIRAPAFDRCLASEGLRAGAQIFIRPCAGSAEQLWRFAPNGRLSPASRGDLCLTIAADRNYAGAPSWLSPVYHMRLISLESCDEAAHIRQSLRWGRDDERASSRADSLRHNLPAQIAAGLRAIGDRIGAGNLEATHSLLADQPRVYEPGELEVVEDLAYGPHERHRLDVHTDIYRRSDGPMPVVVFFHGGGFIRGDKPAYRNVADYFASLGLVGVNATYRLAPEAKWPAGAQDVGAVVTWLRENIGEYGGDPDQIFVIGKSAGAAHVATYVFRPTLLAPGTAAAAGAVLISGSYAPTTAHTTAGTLAYYDGDAARWPEMAVLGNITRTDMPVLVTVSEFDPPRLKRSLASLVHELTVNHGRMPRVAQLLGHNHYSSNLTIGTGDTLLSAEILELVRSSAGARGDRLTAR